MKRVLDLPAYRRLLGAYTLNELAWAIGSLALSFLIYRRTGSAVGAAAFFLSAQFVPALVAPMLVVRVDQLHPRRVLPGLYALEGVLFLALGWLAGRAPVPLVLGLALLDGVLALTARPLARAATAAVTSQAGLLREGNALINTCFSVCFMAGPALGGAVVAAGGASAALFANTGLFLAIALNLAMSRRLPAPAAERVPTAGRLRAAFAYVRQRHGIREVLSLQAGALLFFTLTIPVEVVYAEHSLHAGASGYGILISSWGAGAVVGSAIYARWRGLPGRELIALGALTLGVGFLVTAAAPSLGLAIAGSVIAGVGNGIETIAARTTLQERTEERWMAMVMSFSDSLDPIVTGAGIVAGGAIAALAGPRAALATAGCGALAMTVVVWLVLGSRTAPRASRLEPVKADAMEPVRQ
ncbi:MAG: MFS transporter [Actinomycetota bacterium]|nr:MFS transporter [Actinomycetota bacterium]